MNSKRKIIVAAIVCTIVALLFGVFAVYPVFQGVVQDHDKIVLQKRELAQGELDRNNIRNFEKLSVQYLKEFERLDLLRVDLDNPIDFFKFLDSTAEEAGVADLKKIPGSSRQLSDDPWPSFSVELSGTGVYPDVVTFLQKLENSPYLAAFEKVSFDTGLVSEDAEPGSVAFSILFKVFIK